MEIVYEERVRDFIVGIGVEGLLYKFDYRNEKLKKVLENYKSYNIKVQYHISPKRRTIGINDKKIYVSVKNANRNVLAKLICDISKNLDYDMLDYFFYSSKNKTGVMYITLIFMDEFEFYCKNKQKFIENQKIEEVKKMLIDKKWETELTPWADGGAYKVLLPLDFRKQMNLESGQKLSIKLGDNRELIASPEGEGVKRGLMKIGGSVYLTIPKSLVEMVGWKVGQMFELDGDPETQTVFLRPKNTMNVDKMEVIEDGDRPNNE